MVTAAGDQLTLFMDALPRPTAPQRTTGFETDCRPTLVAGKVNDTILVGNPTRL